jgi:3',5'-cyclic AMP phosphodiesterase CpdA
MGWQFSLDDANTLAWMTWAGRRAPWIRWKDDDHAFLGANRQSAHDLIIRLGNPDNDITQALTSTDRIWPEEIRRICEPYYYRSIADLGIDDSSLLDTLWMLRHEVLAYFEYFAIGTADTEEQYAQVNAFLRQGAIESGRRGLFLIPDRLYPQSSLNLLEPFWAFSKLANVAIASPSILYWSRNGASHRCSLESARELLSVLARESSSETNIDRILEEAERRESHGRSFLHISDLHFGAEDVAAKRAFLITQIKLLSKRHDIKRVVVTGDLLDGPKNQYSQLSRDFLVEVSCMLECKPIVIPGNHDQKKWFGMWRRSYRELSNMDWSSVVIDDELQVVFVCFDSSRDAALARGKVTTAQRIEVGTELASKKITNPACSTYMTVALVHHHPFSFPEENRGMWGFVNRMGFNRETALRMDEADEFVQWCALSRATLILHGHKHVPYHVDVDITVDAAAERPERVRVRSIGCGSSTGVNQAPLSVNLITWDAATRSWSVTFLVDRGDASGFRVAQIAVRKETLSA